MLRRKTTFSEERNIKKKKNKTKKLGFSEINYWKNFFFYFRRSLFFIFLKIWTPVFGFCFWLINIWRNNEHRAMRKKLQKHLQIFFKISVLRNFANFTGKHLFWSLFLIKMQIWRLVRDTCHEKETTEAIAVTQVFSCEILQNF